MFGAERLSSEAGVLSLRAVADGSGFYNMKQNWEASQIRQLEFTVRADQSGYLQFSCNLDRGGEVSQYSAVIASLIPDGEWHTVVFPTVDSAWGGTVTNWELRWRGTDRARVDLKSIDALPYGNAIPNACRMTSQAPFAVPVLRPRARCRLSWRGEGNPGVVVRFLDGNLKEIPGSAQRLSPGESALVEFTTPPGMILTVAELQGEGGDGVPVLEQLDYWGVFESRGKWRGSWLWSQKEPGPNYCNVWMERTFELPEDPEYAVMTYLADDKAYLYINGVYCGMNDNWHVPGRVNLTHVLRKGRNVVKVRVYNGEQAAGFAADLYVRAGGRDFTFDTDERWRCESKRNEPHVIPDKVEEPVVVLGNPHVTAPWMGGAGYRHAGPRGLLALEGDPVPGRFTARILEMPPEPVSRCRVTFTDKKGEKSPREYWLALTPDSSQWKAGEKVTITYPLPPLDSGDYEITLDDDFLGIQKEAPLGVLHTPVRPPTEFRQASLQRVGSRPRILLGDQVVNPTFWHSVAMVRGRRFHEMTLAPRAGVENYRLVLDFKTCWKGEDDFDFTQLEEAVEAMEAACPEAVFSLHINVQMPDWWLDENPDEVCTFVDGSRTAADRYMQSLASRKWVEDASQAIRRVIRHLAGRPYACQVWGVSIAESHNGEWFWPVTDANMDYSWGGYNLCDRRYFQAFLRRKYGTDEALRRAWGRSDASLEALPELPDWKAASQASMGLLRNPAEEQPLMDWLESRNQALAEAICVFAQVIKEESQGRLLAGFYYGYLTELGCNGYLQLPLVGHNGLWTVLQSSCVDFLSAPSRYLWRRTGDADGIMQPWSSLSLHNILTYNEMDYRTGYCRVPEPTSMRLYVGEPSTAYESVGHLNRAFGMNLACGISGYWYDLSAGGLYEPALLDVLREQAALWERLPPVQGTTPSQVAVVGNVESAYYVVPPRGDGVFTNAIEGVFGVMNQLAIPFDSLLLEDLLDPAVTVPPKRLYIMLPTVVLSREQRQGLRERFEREKATVLWLYAAGACYPGEAPSSSSNGDFLGIQTTLLQRAFLPTATTIPEYGALACANRAASRTWLPPLSGFDEAVAADGQGNPWVVRKTQGGATHYYCALMNLPRQVYEEILPRAGVWQYSRKGEDQFWIGNDLLFLYAKKGGRKSLQIPEGMAAEAILGPFQGTLEPGKDTFPALPGMTYGFLLRRVTE